MRRFFWVISAHGNYRPGDEGDWCHARDGMWHLRLTSVDYATRPEAWRAIDALGLPPGSATTVLLEEED